MKGFLFFVGSLFRWAGNKPREFLTLHGYIVLLYIIDHFVESYSSGGLGLIFTLGVLAPLFMLIAKGLPLNCLDYQSAFDREFNSNDTF